MRNRIKRSNIRIKNGYEQFYDSDNQWKFVHREIARVALKYDSIFNGLEVHHMDGNKRNNKPENLIILDIETHKQLHQQENIDLLEALKESRISSIDVKDELKRRAIRGNHKNTFDNKIDIMKKVSTVLQSQKVTKQQFEITEIFDQKKFVDLLSISNVCPRCGGSGCLPQYSHVAGGVCFTCDGFG
ncbi:MAG: HNH endonuclease [Balneolales bacterium]